MKSKIILRAIFTLALTIGLFLQSCTKHEEDHNPCDNPIEVIATYSDMYNEFGHFYYYDNSNLDQFAQSQTFLKIVNWVDYANKVIPGKKYKIGFVEVDCNENNKLGRCGNEFTCGFPILKCAKIMCLDEVKENNDDGKDSKGCFSSELSDNSFDDMRSSVTNFIQIENNSFNAKMYYSGCSYEDPVRYTLYYHPSDSFTDDGMPIVDVKIKEHDRGIICQAVFERDFCFDLNNMKNYFSTRQSEATQLLLKVHLTNNTVVDVIYDMGL
jgi:hypothetical protein